MESNNLIQLEIGGDLFDFCADDLGINGGGDSQTSSTNIRKDLSDWQERHAMLVLSKVKVQAYFSALYLIFSYELPKQKE